MLRTRNLIPLLALCAACAQGFVSSEPAVEVSIDRATYAPGDTVRATVRNVSGETLGYNFCFSELDRRVGSGWATVDVLPGPGMACTQELRHLDAGESAQALRVIPAGTADGSYRIVYHAFVPIQGNGPAVDIVTPGFTVQR